MIGDILFYRALIDRRFELMYIILLRSGDGLSMSSSDVVDSVPNYS